MDEKTAVTQPLMGDYDKKTEPATLDLPAPVQAVEVQPQQTPRQRKWRKAAKFAVLALTSMWLLRGFMPNLFAMEEEFDYSPYESLLESHHADVSVEADSHSDRTLWRGLSPQWITLDNAFFNSTNGTEKFSYNLTTSADKIKIFSRGPIVGKVIITSGETAGDDIEVDVAFRKPWHHHKHHHKNKSDVSEHQHGEHGDFEQVEAHDDDEYERHSSPEVMKSSFWTRAWRAPSFDVEHNKDGEHHHKKHHHHHHHHHAPPLKVKVVPFYNHDGVITSLGIFAHYEKKSHGPHGPHHPPPPPPPRHLPGGDHPHGPKHGDHPHGDHPHGPPPHGGHKHPHKAPWHHGKPKHHRHGPPPAIAYINITFPSSAKLALNKEIPLEIHDFSASLPGFKHIVYDLTAVFGKFELFTVGRPVFVKSLSATFLKIVAIHGPIFGNFAASKVVDLVSAGAPIKANVALYSGPHEKWFNATVFKATTTQSWIKANVSLHSTSSESGTFAPSYYVKTVSTGSSTWRGQTHSGTSLNFTSQPTNTSLVVDAFTRNAPVNLSLADAFEGWYELYSPFSKPVLVTDLTAEDPTGDGRTREVKPKRSWVSFKLSGSVKWVKEDLLGLGLEKRGCGGRKGMMVGRRGSDATNEESAEGRPAFGKVKLVSTRKPATLIFP